MDINIPSQIRDRLDEANSVVNAYKHGEEAIDTLRENHPQNFCAAGETEAFSIPEGALMELFVAVHKFWQEVERQVAFDFDRQYTAEQIRIGRGSLRSRDYPYLFGVKG
jgi:hypothetical protein